MSDDLPTAELHVGNTRPPLFMGVYPWPIAVALGVFTFQLGVKSWWYMVFALPVWALVGFAIRKDYNFHRIVVLWLRTSAIDIHARDWRGSSVSVFPLVPTGRIKALLFRSSLRFRGMH